MHSVYTHRLFKLALVAAPIVGVMAVGLFGNQSSRALAQDAQPQTFMIQAGAFGLSNVEYVAFTPNSLKVHQGDTVMWHFNSFHNVHLGEDKAADLIIAPVVDGKPVPQINPAIAFPTIQSGATYSGGDVTTGLPLGPSAPLTFSMVIDLAPGNYIYYCDVHPGMVGSLEVVANDVAIPTPVEAIKAAADEVTAQLNQAGATIGPALLQPPATSTDGKLAIDAGTGAYGRISIQAFSAPLAIVNVGDSITWTIPTDSVEPHTVTSTNFGGEVFTITPQPNGPPMVAPGAVFVPGAKTDIGASDSFNSGFLTPGQSFSATFTEPGVHSYVCRLHDGMFGVVVVQAKA